MNDPLNQTTGNVDEIALCALHNLAIEAAVDRLNTALREAEVAGFDTSLSMSLGVPHREVKASASVLSAFAKELRNGR